MNRREEIKLEYFFFMNKSPVNYNICKTVYFCLHKTIYEYRVQATLKRSGENLVNDIFW